MEVSNMMKKLMSLGLVGILSASLMVGCSSNNDRLSSIFSSSPSTL